MVKKFLKIKFIVLFACILSILWVHLNALSYFFNILVGNAYFPVVAENWWIIDIFLAVPILTYILYRKSTVFRSHADKVLSHVINSKTKSFFSITKRKLYLALGLIAGSFFVGWCVAIIMSENYENYLAMFFYFFAPEVALFQTFRADWVDAQFVISTVGITLMKWIIFYVIAACWFHYRPTMTIGAEQ